ncbi:MAG: hypothetical protein H6607_07520 [Flavobacteriales bacterium]|nr:hypothetical protein [Flavobacteriales bacterium]
MAHRILGFIGICVLATICQAQVSTFDLSKYKLADVKYKSFDNYFDNTSYGDKSNDWKTPKPNSKYLSSSFRYSGYFYTNFNSRKRQTVNTFNISTNGNRRTTEINDRTSSTTLRYDWSPSFSQFYSNRFYYKNNRFFEYQVMSKWLYEQYRNEAYSDELLTTREVHNDYSGSVGTAFKYGKGRLEQVDDARQATFLLDYLQRVGRCRTDISDQKILELATFITTLRNRRFFDTRLLKIWQIEQLDSFFQHHDLATNSDAKYFATLTDYWSFGATPTRFSGNRLAMAIYPAVGYYTNEYRNTGGGNLYTYNSEGQYNRFFWGFEFDHEKPISQKWQHSINSQIYWGSIRFNSRYKYSYNNDYSEWSPFKEKGIQLHVNNGIGFYPNTRTAITLNTRFTHLTYNHEDNEIFIWYPKSFGLALNSLENSFDIQYYISPKFRINWSFSNQIRKVQKANDTSLDGPLQIAGLSIYDQFLEPSQLAQYPLSQSQFGKGGSFYSFYSYLTVSYALF